MEKLRQQQQGRGPALKVNLKGTDDSGFATAVGELIIGCIWSGLKITFFLCGVAVVGFALGIGIELAKRFVAKVLL